MYAGHLHQVGAHYFGVQAGHACFCGYLLRAMHNIPSESSNLSLNLDPFITHICVAH